MLLVTDVQAQRNGRPIVGPLSFRLDPGDCCNLHGPAGSGKTLLLKMLLREVQPDGGTILVDGVDIRRLHAEGLRQYRLHVGASMQECVLLERLSVRENVALPLRLGRPDRSGGIGPILSVLGLGESALRTPAELSYAQRRLVAIARALAGYPPLVYLDDPFAGIPPEDVERITALLTEGAAQGCSILLLSREPVRDAVAGMRCQSITGMTEPPAPTLAPASSDHGVAMASGRPLRVAVTDDAEEAASAHGTAFGEMAGL